MALSISACVSTPGIEEPAIEECNIITDKILECEDANGNRRDISILDAIGYKAISQRDAAKAISHHEALHIDLNKCQDSKIKQ